MRRNDREIRDFDEMLSIMERCDVCRLALNDEGYPYILPLNFGMRLEEGNVVLYFHGATEGTKYQLIEKDNRASFEMDCAHKLVLDDENMSCTMEYESIIGKGIIDILTEEEKYDALVELMRHYHKEDFAFNRAVMSRTTVFKLTVSEMTGKKRKKYIND